MPPLTVVPPRHRCMFHLHSQPVYKWLPLDWPYAQCATHLKRKIDCRVQMSKALLHQCMRAKAAKGSLWDPHRLQYPAGPPQLSPVAWQGTSRTQSIVVLQTIDKARGQGCCRLDP